MKWRKRTALVVAIILIVHCCVLPAAAESETAETTESIDELPGILGDAVGFLSEIAEDAAEVVQGAAGTVSEKAGEFGTAVSEQAGKASSAAGDILNRTGETVGGIAGNVSEAAGHLSETVSAVSDDVKDKAEKAASQAMSSLNGAANVVVDQAGNVKNMAVEGAETVADSVAQAYEVIRDKGSELMQMAQQVIANIDVSDPEQLNSAKEALDKVVTEAFADGSLGVKVSPETIQIITDVVFWTAVYGIQYSQNQISLPEYASLMSVVIIRNGLPTGVGFVADRLPIPGAGDLARTVTKLLIEAAYGNGQEDVLTEENEEAASS